MSKDMVRDILIKAAEDVQSGMWCKGEWFDGQDEVGQWTTPEALLRGLTTEQMEQSKRCAEGSLVYVARLLGARLEEAAEASRAVAAYAGFPHLYQYNDRELPDDPFTAGQTLAELFRNTAGAL